MPVVAIEHVGRTAVPGLAAKPIIDCDIVVTADRVASAAEVLAALGFQPEGELGIPQRWAFKEPSRLRGTHTYVVVEGSLALRNHRGLHDTLLADVGLRDRYNAEKKRIAASAGSIAEYSEGKSAVIEQILAAAGLDADERRVIDVAHSPALRVTPTARASTDL